ncbi:MAG TPA: ornithine cyclodeaminase, partial [Geminicoccaceae bacterium]|nr:ornithine cyclodeaminase [Geminicoccaceae bacterium]
EPPQGAGWIGEGFLVLPAWAHGRAFGVKMVTIVPGNAELEDGPPTVQAVYQLFEGVTGRPVAVIDGTALTLRKTAADSGLGAKLLARGDAKTLLMIGAGALAPHLIGAHLAVRPSLARVMVWNRSAPRRDRLLAELAQQGFPAEASDDLEAAVRTADVISAATLASEPLVRGAWLRPGTHVDLVGAYTPQMREADDEAMRRAGVHVDYRGSTVGESGELIQPIASGAITEQDVLGDLFDLCQGRTLGRRAADEITLYKNGGGSHLDLFTAEFLLRQLAGEA